VKLFTSLLLVASIAIASSVRAQPRFVEVTLGSSELDSMRPVLDELMARHDVRSVVSTSEGIELSEVVRPRDDPSRLGYVWIDQRSPQELTVYIADATASRILVRSIALDAAVVDEVARETVGHIVEATVDALAQGTPIGRPREEIERELGVEASPEPPEVEQPPVEPPAPPEAPTPDVTFGLGVNYSARGYADELVLHGPGLQLEIRGRDPVRFGGRISGSFYPPITRDAQLAGVELIGGAGFVDALLDLQLAPAVYLGFSLGVGVDALRVTPHPGADPDVALADPFTMVAVLVRGSIGLMIDPPDVPIAFRLDYWLGVDPTDVRYVVRRSGGAEPVLDPWLAQPSGRFTILWQP
jgi:hypothetical protein